MRTTLSSDTSMRRARRIADHHRDRHGFAQSPRQSQKDGSQDAKPRGHHPAHEYGAEILIRLKPGHKADERIARQDRTRDGAHSRNRTLPSECSWAPKGMRCVRRVGVMFPYTARDRLRVRLIQRRYREVSFGLPLAVALVPEPGFWVAC